ncbi:MAG: amino acid carrier protein [Rickettsiaceae bacterium]
MDYLFEIIDFLSNFYWSYIGWGVICVAGVYFTIISRGLQFRAIVNFKKNIKDILLEGSSKTNAGIHPIKLYFASVGGMVGLGNIVGISTALMIGGPGSIFWTIVASICGMLIKYSEIYLGVKHRVSNKDGGFDGGPMYYLQDAFKNNYIAYFVAFLICLYGVEVYQFTVLVDRIEYSFEFNRIAIILGLLALVLYSSIGGIKRLASICTVIMPAFMIIYIFVALYIIISNITLLPEFFATVFYSAFAGQAPIGGFVGSSMILATYHGMSKAVYSGDIGIGYDSIVQSETNIVNPKKQATLAIYALFTDTLICILTNTMLGVTGAWHNLNHLSETNVVSHTIANYFPHSNLFVTLLLFFAGFTTLIAYIATGIKCAKYLSPKYGKIIYLLYAIFAFIFFCNYSSVKILTVMGLLSGILVLINVSGMIKLRKEIKF